MLQHAQHVSGNVSQTCRFFGVSRALFYIWKKRYEKNGLAEEFYRGRHFRHKRDLTRKLKKWEAEYNAEQVQELTRPSKSVKDLSINTYPSIRQKDWRS